MGGSPVALLCCYGHSVNRGGPAAAAAAAEVSCVVDDASLMLQTAVAANVHNYVGFCHVDLLCVYVCVWVEEGAGALQELRRKDLL